MSPRGDVRPGWKIVLEEFLSKPDRSLTNIELGDIRGVQAFRSRISDLRRMGCAITEGTYVRQGVYRYRLESWPPELLKGSGSGRSPEAPKQEPPAQRIAAEQDAAAEQPQLFAPDAGPANALTADF